jgi:hypothetical protein
MSRQAVTVAAGSGYGASGSNWETSAVTTTLVRGRRWGQLVR